jgi:cytochrome P450
MWPIRLGIITVWGIFPWLTGWKWVLDEAAIEQILQTDNLPKSVVAYRTLQPVIGKTSLVSIGGEHWKKLRKMFNPAFAPSHLETMIPAIVQESEVFCEKLNEVAESGKVVRMNELTTVCLLDIFSDDSIWRLTSSQGKFGLLISNSKGHFQY